MASLIWELIYYVCVQGAIQKVTEIEQKGKSFMQARKIRQFDESFNTKEFAQQALDIYVEAHQLLQE